jgi:glycosyltransferase involved in cell wall biosynthesis
MKVSVIVATYEAPRELDLVLTGLARQTAAPLEVLVADDGSGPETRAVLEKWQARAPWPLLHCWQEDQGFRKGRIANEAVRRSRGDWLCFLDGDAIPHSEWLADHLAFADGCDVLCGRRVKLGPSFSSLVDGRMVESGELERVPGPVFWGGLFGDNKRTGLGLRLPRPLVRILHAQPRKLMGVNFSLSRAAIEKVNGWDEEWPGRREDRDIDLRLARSGARFRALLNRAVVYHLFHTERPNSSLVEARVLEEERSARIRCRVGLVADASPDQRT